MCSCRNPIIVHWILVLHIVQDQAANVFIHRFVQWRVAVNVRGISILHIFDDQTGNLIVATSKFVKIVCEGEKVRTRGCNSSSAWYKLSFEPSTTSVRFVL